MSFENNEYKLAPNYSNVVSAAGEFSESLNTTVHGNTEPSKIIDFEGATTIQQWSRVKGLEAPAILEQG